MEDGNYVSSYMSELRRRILSVGIFFMIALVAGMLFSKKLVVLFLNSNLPGNVNLVTLNPYENVSLLIYFGFFVAITLTFPFMIYNIIKYINPGLKKDEKKIVFIIPFVALFLFIIGASLGYFLTKSIIVPFLSDLALSIGIVNNWSINQFMKFVVYLSMALGLIFQMPLIISMLVRFNLLKPSHLKKVRKHVIIGLIILAAIITPPDFFSLIIMVVPLVILFEITIFIARFMKRDVKKEVAV
ncbi:twin-arginine translocase subunit TatC [Candidatus Woesearchaeota archaeon]|nr:twin-arginine translocase subunit TatC [Candidatus Woesearchaeota archaeon]|tara:strand:- start:909 stop:1637 length:729 start_codon:yes stop_codon:yes gene_type:complete